MMEVVLDVMNMEGWINDIASRYLSPITIIDCIPWRGTGGQAIFRIPEGRGESMIQAIRSHPEVTTADVEEVEDGCLVGTVGMRNCLIIRRILESGCFMECARAEGDGIVRFKILVGVEGSIPGLIKRLNEMGLVIEIRRLTRMEEIGSVTKRQKELITLALEKGYFDYPSKVTIKELSEISHVSPSTLREVLTRAEKNILIEYIKRDGRTQ